MKKLLLLLAIISLIASAGGCAFLTGAGVGAVAAQEHAEEEHCGDDDFDPLEDECD